MYKIAIQEQLHHPGNKHHPKVYMFFHLQEMGSTVRRTVCFEVVLMVLA